MALALLVLQYPRPSISVQNYNPESSEETSKEYMNDIEPDPTPHMKRLNNGLTVVTILIAVIHIVRNSVDGNENLSDPIISPLCVSQALSNDSTS